MRFRTATLQLITGAAFIAASQLPGALAQEAGETAAIENGQGNGAENTAPTALPEVTLKGPAEVALPKLPEGTEPDINFVYGVFQRGWYLTALALATPLAESGNVAAQTLLGVLHETGLGIRQDKQKAAEWYQLAANAGDPGAAMQLAQFYLLGTGVPADKKKAADLFEVAANAGNPSALYNLALLYQAGDGRPYNESKARQLLEEAATRNDPEAQYALGLSYLEGPSGLNDPKKGAFWLGRAARQGHTSAQVYYGILRFQGKGVDPDEAEAADWFERAATAGNPVAMNRLARIYAYGRGRQLDPVAAAGWHYVSRALGVSDLRLDGFVESLDDETRLQARKKAEQFSATLIPPEEAPGQSSP
jgi:uncharacterized protein